MEAPDKWLYEYCVVRYVPDPERGEFINIGLLMLCKRCKWMKGAINLDAGKLRGLNPRVDIDLLKKQASLFERIDVPGADLPIEERYRWLAAEKSAAIRVSPSHPGLILPEDKEEESASAPEILEKEFQRLFQRLVK